MKKPSKRKARIGRHPMQPVVMVGKVARFKANKIVEMLLESHPTIDMHEIACMSFSRADRNQFAQLIGYSVDGFAELGYSFPSDIEAADKMVVEILPKRRGGR